MKTKENDSKYASERLARIEISIKITVVEKIEEVATYNAATETAYKFIYVALGAIIDDLCLQFPHYFSPKYQKVSLLVISIESS